MDEKQEARDAIMDRFGLKNSVTPAKPKPVREHMVTTSNPHVRIDSPQALAIHEEQIRAERAAKEREAAPAKEEGTKPDLGNAHLRDSKDLLEEVVMGKKKVDGGKEKLRKSLSTKVDTDIISSLIGKRR